LAEHTRLFLPSGLRVSFIDIEGGPHSTVVNNGTISYLVNGDNRIDADLAGRGTVEVTRAHDGNGTFEVNGAVGPGQTFNITSRSFSASLIIDQPKAFHGSVDIEPDPLNSFASASITLVGLGSQATSFDLKNDMLRLFDGQKVIDTLRVVNMTSEPMSVAQNGSNVVVGFGATAPGNILPPHGVLHPS
jgi:hypothetical protein